MCASCLCLCLSLHCSLLPTKNRMHAASPPQQGIACFLCTQPSQRISHLTLTTPSNSILLPRASSCYWRRCFNFEVELQGCDSIYWVREGDFRIKTKTDFSSKAGIVLLSERASDCCENQRAPKSIQQLAFLVSGFPRIWARNWETEQQSRRTYSISIRLRGNFAENFWARDGKRRKEETRETREKGEQALSRGGSMVGSRMRNDPRHIRRMISDPRTLTLRGFHP